MSDDASDVFDKKRIYEAIDLTDHLDLSQNTLTEATINFLKVLLGPFTSANGSRGILPTGGRSHVF
jgi:hypothetical protein